MARSAKSRPAAHPPAAPSRPVVTAQWIAREVGLGRSTVSHVLNRRGDQLGIKPETQQRIFELAERLNYSPNPLAKGLVGGRTMSVGILWSLCGPHESGAIARRMTQQLQQRGYVTYLADHMTNRMTLKALRDFSQRHVDAVVVQDLAGKLSADPQAVQVIKSFAAATVVSAVPLDVPYDLIIQDRTKAMREAADYLVRSGRKRPIVVAPLESDRLKIEAFAQTFRDGGVRIDRNHYIDVPHDDGAPLIDALVSAMNARFGDQIPFDAAWCSSDEEAVGLIDWLIARGKRVPQDVAVIGFNDALMSGYLRPRLASVHRYDEDVVDQIVTLLMQRLGDPKLPPQRRYIDMKFIHRESAG